MPCCNGEIITGAKYCAFCGKSLLSLDKIYNYLELDSITLLYKNDSKEILYADENGTISLKLILESFIDLLLTKELIIPDITEEIIINYMIDKVTNTKLSEEIKKDIDNLDITLYYYKDGFYEYEPVLYTESELFEYFYTELKVFKKDTLFTRCFKYNKLTIYFMSMEMNTKIALLEDIRAGSTPIKEGVFGLDAIMLLLGIHKKD